MSPVDKVGFTILIDPRDGADKPPATAIGLGGGNLADESVERCNEDTKALLRMKYKSNKVTRITKAWRKEGVLIGLNLNTIWITPCKTEATKVSDYDGKANMPG